MGALFGLMATGCEGARHVGAVGAAAVARRRRVTVAPVLDLRAATWADTAPLVPPELSLSEEDRRHAVHEWRGRMRSEHVSARFGASDRSSTG